MDQLYFSIVCDGCLGDVGRVCGVARLAVRANLFRFQILLIGVLVIAHLLDKSLYPLRGNPGSKLFEADRNLANNRFCGTQ